MDFDFDGVSMIVHQENRYREFPPDHLRDLLRRELKGPVADNGDDAPARRRQAEVRKAQEAAQGALRAALSRHGIDELSVYPTLSAAEGELKFTRTRLFGLEILEAE
jgi:hypothetical protein